MISERSLIDDADALPRSRSRTRVLMGGTLFTPNGAQRVLMRDVSVNGAQVSGDDAIPHSCDAVFKKGSLFVAARVIRSRGSEAGIRFYRELTPAELDSLFHPVAR
jgi:hypothetical protein